MLGRKGSGRTAGRRSTAGKKRGQAGTGTSADKKKTGPVGVRKSTAKKKTGQAGTGTSAAGKKAGKAQKTSRPFAVASTPFKTFPIVGIGASAGGLHALEGFFSHMPADPNMAFVVIQHLAPKHKSIMGTLLERRSAIKIRPVEDGLKIEPACVYLNPPDKNVAVVGGVFSLVDQGSPHASNLPIDYFLRSLAEDRGEMAICIILSGTGSDGTLGLRAIKGEGGTAMVQRVDQAEHGSMPRSAIMTGLVDYILPVEAMPAELLRFTSHAFAGAGLKHVGKQGEPEAPLRRIFHSIRSATGTDFSEYKRTTTLRRIHRRMAVHQIERLADYVKFLEREPGEVRSLCRDMLITVTSFFRDPEAFDVLAETVLPDLLTREPLSDPLRIWVPGCGTGEEAYSITILVIEAMRKLKKQRDIQMFATDLDEASINQARAGAYPESIHADVDPKRLKAFFKRDDSMYRIGSAVRDIVVFAVQNLIKDPPFSRIDLVSCRNVLIYLNPGVQKRLLSLFCYTLSPGGFLFLGPSETIGDFSMDLLTVDPKWKIFRRRRGAPAMPREFPQATEPVQAVTAVPREVPISTGMPRFAMEVILKNYAPPCVIVNEKYEAVYFHGETGKYLSPPVGEPNLNIVNMAHADLRHELVAALSHVVTRRRPVVAEGIRVKYDGGSVTFNLVVKPLKGPGRTQDLILVGFEGPREVKKRSRKAKGPQKSGVSRTDRRIAALEDELALTRQHLQCTVEQLEGTNEELTSANEELQSTNEELQSANEELETSREELQSANEELHVANAELQGKILELGRAHDDLRNLLASTEIASLFLDSSFCIKGYTPAVKTVFNVIDSDVGRPISDISSRLDYDSLVEDSRNVAANLQPVVKKVPAGDQGWYEVRIRPYRTLDNVIDGVVLTFINISQIEEAYAAMSEARAFATAVVDTVRESLLVLDKDMRVVFAGQSFCDTFGVLRKETEGSLLSELGTGEWDIPRLRDLLGRVLSEDRDFVGFEVEHVFPAIGRKTMVLNAKRLKPEAGREVMILLAIEDIADREAARG